MKLVRNSGFLSLVALKKRFSHILSTFSNSSLKNTSINMHEKY
jgi:hypothetical protein